MRFSLKNRQHYNKIYTDGIAMKSGSLKFVLAGGPGVGKTTLIEQFKLMGFQVVPEATTYLVNELLRQGKPHPIHSGDLQSFQDNISYKNLELEAKLNNDMDTFFDRCIIESLAYYELYNLKIPPEIINIAKNRRYDIIFLLDPLDSFQNSEVRFESPKEAKRTHLAIAQKYKEFQNPIINVPTFCRNKNGIKLSEKESIEHRVEFIYSKITELKKHRISQICL